MFTGLNYEPNEVLKDYFIPITSGVEAADEIDRLIENRRETLDRLKKELEQRRVPAPPSKTQHVYVPAGVPDCYVERATTLPSWSRERDTSCKTDHDTEFHVLRRIKYRMEQIERIDRRTWGLYYGALDIWSYIVYAFDKITDVVSAIKTLGARRFRKYWGRKVKHLARVIYNEQEKNREARSGRTSETR